ncbi:hypothetical protein RND71_001345 [Anisodus tanguticus]|uniref:Uncharacterized protein n=1 Tax=Anisodus tanguticus TaxID=243964 RepID=A0AAE1SXQ7_9SOLA|nr:hypothetical protein RND71_001345 [Anisodus tanguticus]
MKDKNLKETGSSYAYVESIRRPVKPNSNRSFQKVESVKQIESVENEISCISLNFGLKHMKDGVFRSSRRACGFWEKYNDVVRLAEDFGSRFDALDTLFEDLDSRFVGVINVVENLVRLHDESKLFGGAAESICDVNLPIVKATTIDILILDEVSCKRRRCDDGKKDDDDLPCWNLITQEDSVVEKCMICGDRKILGRGPHFPTLNTMLTSQDYLNKKGKGVVDEFTLTERDDESEDEITSLEDRVKESEKKGMNKLFEALEKAGLKFQFESLVVQSLVDVVDSPPNDFGGDDFDGVDFRGSATEVVLDDVARASTE